MKTEGLVYCFTCETHVTLPHECPGPPKKNGEGSDGGNDNGDDSGPEERRN